MLYYFFLLSLYTVYTSPKTATQAETIEQAVSITAIPYLPIFTTGVIIISYIINKINRLYVRQKHRAFSYGEWLYGSPILVNK
jgi:hypothetical protein